jgi:hypothetical protein
MRKIRPGSKADHARMPSKHPVKESTGIATRTQVDIWIGIIIANPQKRKPWQWHLAKARLMKYAKGGYTNV